MLMAVLPAAPVKDAESTVAAMVVPPVEKSTVNAAMAATGLKKRLGSGILEFMSAFGLWGFAVVAKSETRMKRRRIFDEWIF